MLISDAGIRYNQCTGWYHIIGTYGAILGVATMDCTAVNGKCGETVVRELVVLLVKLVALLLMALVVHGMAAMLFIHLMQLMALLHRN